MKKKVSPLKPRGYVDPRLAKATLILREMLNSLRLPPSAAAQLKAQ